jgi:hypothetical protein
MICGQDWRLKIRLAITDGAFVFIARFSQASLSKGKSYQNEELTLAIEEMRLRSSDEPWFIPVCLDDCVIPDRDIGGGRTLASIQRVDLFGNHSDENAVRLVDSVLRILAWYSGRPPSGSDTSHEVGSPNSAKQSPGSLDRLRERAEAVRFKEFSKQGILRGVGGAVGAIGITVSIIALLLAHISHGGRPNSAAPSQHIASRPPSIICAMTAFPLHSSPQTYLATFNSEEDLLATRMTLLRVTVDACVSQ